MLITLPAIERGIERSREDHRRMARYRITLGPVPLHHQVYLDLAGALAAGEWRPGDRLPPERELARRYGCSLITVRRALGDLARDGLLSRRQGQGTFVLQPRIDRDLGEARSFSEEMLLRGLAPETRLTSARPESANHAIARALGLEVGAPTLHLERLRMADGEPLLLEQVWLSAERFPGLLALDLERGSLYDLLASRYDARIAWTRESLDAMALPSREAGLLRLRPRAPVLRIEGVAFDAADRPVEVGHTWVRGDRTRYFVVREVGRRPVASGTEGLSAGDGAG
ncbi:MAG: GntR family transcriptional regulator [Chloroflexota bacterium]